jgi:hypothetical protein
MRTGIWPAARAPLHVAGVQLEHTSETQAAGESMLMGNDADFANVRRKAAEYEFHDGGSLQE